MKFISYLILTIIPLNNNGYSFNNKQIQNNDVIENYNLFGNGYSLVTSKHHFEFPNSIVKCYLNPSEKCKCSVYVHKNFGYPDSQLIKIDTSDGVFSLPNNSLLLPDESCKCGVIKFNNKYYFGWYQIEQNNNNFSYDWWYVLKKNDGLWCNLGIITL